MHINSKTFVLLAFSLFLGLSSCKKEDNDDNGGGSTSNELKVTINGTVWTGTISSTAVSDGVKQLNATKSDGSSFQIFMPENASGSFDLATSDDITLNYSEGSVFWSDALSGTLMIDANSNSSGSGTFSGTLASFFGGQDTLVLTNGSYSYSF